jgi:hypothetical protein
MLDGRTIGGVQADCSHIRARRGSVGVAAQDGEGGGGGDEKYNKNRYLVVLLSIHGLQPIMHNKTLLLLLRY